ncbi:S8 family serine peptidase [Actinoplanes sp. NPDC049802]|uniref:S8 family serine peptidase n=1 Tax=Actinoplanes sp. NPDC049802 TaxID=3154742 RepID=UPI0034077E7A
MRRVRPLTRTLVVIAAGLAVVLPGSAARAETVRQAQWYLDELRINQVHQITKGRGVLIGLVDSGVDTGHPDLKGRIKVGPRFDSTVPTTVKPDTDGHGTGMAGVIVGKGGGRNHVLGIAPQATVLSVQGAADGQDNVANRAAIEWAVDNGAQVLNLSFAQNEPAEDLTKAIEYALAKDVVVVAGAGNLKQGHYEVGYPAAIPGVIAVSGTSRGGKAWDLSAIGDRVVLSAPADGIVSTASRASGNTSGFRKGVGTSDSAAIVSGAAALVRAKYPELKAPDVINRLITTADDAGPAGRDERYGFGRLDILKALTAEVPSVTTNPLGGVAGTGSGTASAGTDRVAADRGTRVGLTGKAIAGFAIIGLLPVLGIVAIIWLVVGNRRRKRDRLAPAGGYPYPPQPGYPPPPGYAPPPGYPSHPQHYQQPPSAPPGAGR